MFHYTGRLLLRLAWSEELPFIGSWLPNDLMRRKFLQNVADPFHPSFLRLSIC